MEIPELAMNPLLDRFVSIFDVDANKDIDFIEFISALSIFSDASNREEKLKCEYLIFLTFFLCSILSSKSFWKFFVSPSSSHLSKFASHCDLFCDGCFLFFFTLTFSNPIFTLYFCLIIVTFKVYDIDGDGFIGNGELYQVLKMMVGANLTDVQLQQIVDKTILEADKDKDGKLSYEEYVSVRCIRMIDVNYTALID
jgi:Ca2+-binding EF-hand superfamily protein